VQHQGREGVHQSPKQARIGFYLGFGATINIFNGGLKFNTKDRQEEGRRRRKQEGSTRKIKIRFSATFLNTRNLGFNIRWDCYGAWV
jgi:hypothetical protein